jgi:hypothetical protein
VVGGPIALVPINAMMTVSKYVKILKDNLLPFLEEQPLTQLCIFQYGNAPFYKARITVDFLHSNSVDLMDIWPPSF